MIAKPLMPLYLGGVVRIQDVLVLHLLGEEHLLDVLDQLVPIGWLNPSLPLSVM